MNKTVLKENEKINYSVKEALKTLRTNFMFCGPDIKTVLITSCISSEGKSTISMELAKSLAISEKKVLFIDADLRKSVMASKCTENSKKVVGLTEYLSGQANYDDVLYATQYENLSLIFAGAVPPNPVELLGSSKFKELIEKARNEYDYVIVDAAPLGMVIDASVISRIINNKSYIDENKVFNPNAVVKPILPDLNCHYYNHEKVSAYESLFFRSLVNPLDYAVIIRWHMQPYFWERDNNEKLHNKYRKLWGENLYQDIMKIHEADKASH